MFTRFKHTRARIPFFFSIQLRILPCIELVSRTQVLTRARQFTYEIRYNCTALHIHHYIEF
jgi:hypothetical protein